MGVKNRIEDALLLWQNGHLEGAMLCALVAVAATARRRYPDGAVSDREAFVRLLTDSDRVRLSVEYRGECHPVEYIFYKWLRCELIHEGGIPIDIEFVPDAKPGTRSVRAGGAPEHILKLSHSWFDHVIGTVVSAPENKGFFDDLTEGEE